MNLFDWFALIVILAAAFAGGSYPLIKRNQKTDIEMPGAEAFAAGVFLALSLIIMLPAAFNIFRVCLPEFNFPVESVIAILMFLCLLSLEHFTVHLKEHSERRDGRNSPVIPIIMTVMIAIPSFFLGTALGISTGIAAIFIFIAIIVHKSSAGFALALKMVRSTLTRNQTYLLFTLFACATPVGILAGADIHNFFSGREMMIVKGTVLSLASGTFLYMSTLHELRHAPLIATCHCRRGFLLLLFGFIITALVRLLMGTAHHL